MITKRENSLRKMALEYLNRNDTTPNAKVLVEIIGDMEYWMTITAFNPNTNDEDYVIVDLTHKAGEVIPKFVDDYSAELYNIHVKSVIEWGNYNC